MPQSTSSKPRLTPWRWVAPTAILALAALLRLWALGRPDALVFDELYYVRDAVSQLTHGVPTAWPDNDPAFGSERSSEFTDAPRAIAHPPLGKWLIGLGVLLFGADTGWGWRAAVAAAGVATVALTMRLGWLLSGSRWVANVAGLLLAVDGVHVALSRVALLDGLLTFFVLLGALCIWRDQQESSGRLWWRPWLLAAGLAFGAATAVKWSGLYALLAFGVLVAVRELVMGEDHRARLRALTRAVVSPVLVLPVACAVYVASWAGYLVRTPDAWQSLWRWHAHTLGWHATLDSPHPFASHPLTWPLGLRPTAMYVSNADGLSAVIASTPNLAVTWGGVAALLVLGWVLLRATLFAMQRRSLTPVRASAVWVSAFVLTGYLSGWLPWLMVPRTSVFQFYAVVMTPFAALALALVLATVRAHRWAVAAYLAAAVCIAFFFWSSWSAQPVPTWFSHAHAWLPGWY